MNNLLRGCFRWRTKCSQNYTPPSQKIGRTCPRGRDAATCRVLRPRGTLIEPKAAEWSGNGRRREDREDSWNRREYPRRRIRRLGGAPQPAAAAAVTFSSIDLRLTWFLGSPVSNVHYRDITRCPTLSRVRSGIRHEYRESTTSRWAELEWPCSRSLRYSFVYSIFWNDFLGILMLPNRPHVISLSKLNGRSSAHQ